MTPTVALFDVDGTLISCGGAGRAAMQRAFEELCGRGDVLDFAFGGLTDRAIVRAGLRAAGASDDPEAMARLIERYLVHLHEMLPNTASYRVLPGVEALLANVFALAGVAIGLGTGNVERGARAKLARGGLSEHFGFGGFGCDDEDRSALLRAGAERGSGRLGVEPGACRVIVIGDTPRDVAAAHAIGARCLAVATGSHGEAELAASGADWVVADLTHPQAMQALRGD